MLLIQLSLGIGCLLLIVFLLDEDEGVDVNNDRWNLDDDVDEDKEGGSGRRLAFIEIDILLSLVPFNLLWIYDVPSWILTKGLISFSMSLHYLWFGCNQVAQKADWVGW